jgi:hypothetical protein
MLKNCEDWRASVGGKGMDDLYREIDPFDVRVSCATLSHLPTQRAVPRA